MNNNFMRPNQNNNNKNRNRNRNRRNVNTGGSGGGGGSGANKVFDSNGPDIKLRGTTQTIAEKYMQLGRDAQSSGDSVAAENYYQHAEHYYRLWAANQPVGHSLQMSRKLGEEEFDEDGEEISGDDDAEGGNADNAAEGGAAADAAPLDPNAPQGEGQQGRQNRNNNFRDNNNRDNNRNFRPRWPNSRNNRNYENRDGGVPTDHVVASVTEGVPDVAQVAPAPMPIVAEAEGQWEAPSFLQRPTPVVTESFEAPPAALDETPAPRKYRPRKPRVDADAPVDDGSNTPE